MVLSKIVWCSLQIPAKIDPIWCFNHQLEPCKWDKLPSTREGINSESKPFCKRSLSSTMQNFHCGPGWKLNLLFVFLLKWFGWKRQSSTFLCYEMVWVWELFIADIYRLKPNNNAMQTYFGWRNNHTNHFQLRIAQGTLTSQQGWLFFCTFVLMFGPQTSSFEWN